MLGTFRILRARWQEVLLITGLQGASGFAASQILQIASSNNSAAFGSLFFAALLFAIFLVVAKMLALGFARTSFTDGPMHYEPWTLFKIGHHYFWRILGYEMLVWLIGSGIGIGLWMAAILAGVNIEQQAKEPINLISISCAAGGMLLVARLMLFGPAAIMVTDCGLFGAFGWLSWLRLRRAKLLVAMYVLWIAAELGKRLLIANILAIVGFSLAQGLLALIIYVKAVKTVGEVYIQSRHTEDGFGEEPQPDMSENQGGDN
jgi:hypothetical protein